MRKVCLIPALFAVFALLTLPMAQAAPPAAASAAKPVPAEKSTDGKLRIIIFGAHPDDAELVAGGTGALWAAQGHHVKYVSGTNGDIGHAQVAGPELAARRKAEVQAADKLLGGETQVLDIHDGELMPTLENRRAITRLIRQWRADIVIVHRPWDYHPDHRYLGQLVQDSAFMVTVPFFCPETPYLIHNPVFMTSFDGFQQPIPSRADVVVAIDDVIEKKVDALMLMESQFVEGGALGYVDPLPENDPAAREARKVQARERMRQYSEIHSNQRESQYRDKLIELYGEEIGKNVKYAEAFEVNEYGRQPTPAEMKQLFPFFPDKE